MDAQDTKQIVETAQAAFELKMFERLRKTEEEVTNKVRTIESKLGTLEQIAWVIGVLAVVFGVSSGWGWKLLLGAKTELEATKTELEATKTELDTTKTELDKLEPLYVEKLQKAGTEQLRQFREDVKREADAAFAGLRSEISSIASSNELQTGSLKIVNAEGRTLISLAAEPAGGLVEIFSTISGKQIAKLGASNYGGGVWLSDNSGQELLVGDAWGVGGTWRAYNAKTGKEIVYLGASFRGDASTDGDGGLWLNDKNGTPIPHGEGGLWLSEKNGTPIQR
jgi:hypothetical protein